MQLTMIMNTTGHHPDLIAEAIGSALWQTCRDFKLVINCIHPDGLHLDREYDNVIINNIEPFDKYPEQIAWGLSQVDTPYWCVLDSDDYILPHHVEGLLHSIQWIQCIPKLTKKHAVGYNGFIWYENDTFKTWYTAGWMRFAFTKLNADWITGMALRHKTQNKFDTTIFNRVPCKIMVDLPPSYIYRYGQSWHVSKGGKYPKFEELPIIVPKRNELFEGKFNAHSKSI